MKYESNKIQSQKSQQELFEFLSKVENYEELMPENTEFSLMENGFYFQLKGMPKVGLKLKEKLNPEYILFESPNGNFNYEMKFVISKGEQFAEVYIDFEGKFNPMIEMMVKKPLTNFVKNLVAKMEEKL